jgi:hypothetical protein
MAASMGAFLLGAGAKGKRRALPNSRIMIHQPLGGKLWSLFYKLSIMVTANRFFVSICRCSGPSR